MIIITTVIRICFDTQQWIGLDLKKSLNSFLFSEEKHIYKVQSFMLMMKIYIQTNPKTIANTKRGQCIGLAHLYILPYYAVYFFVLSDACYSQSQPYLTLITCSCIY